MPATHASLPPSYQCEHNRWLTQISEGNIKLNVIKLPQEIRLKASSLWFLSSSWPPLLIFAAGTLRQA